MAYYSSAQGKCRKPFWLFTRADATTGLIPIRRSARLKGQADAVDKPVPISVLQMAHPQLQSSFFQRLPQEVRQFVYVFALQSESRAVHLRMEQFLYHVNGGNFLPAKPSKLSSLSCKANIEDAPCINFQDCHSKNCEVRVTGYNHCECRSLALLGLSRACRQMYAETVSVLYGQRLFNFQEVAAVERFCNNLLTHQQFTQSPLKFVQDVHFAFVYVERPSHSSINQTTCAALRYLAGEATSLRSFSMILHSRYPCKRGAKWPLSRDTLKALGTFRGLQVFEIDLLGACQAHPRMKEHAVMVDALRELVYQPGKLVS